jgi:Putative zinc finger in N-recognin (UBR box)
MGKRSSSSAGRKARAATSPLATPSPSSRQIYPCTYDVGHARQDVYACKKCSSAQPSGFCESCKFACHGDHLDDVFDLYSKRGFRCDCGNSRTENGCQLDPHKPAENVGNAGIYSHNFEGRYCRCDRGYSASLGSMSQCLMCEDWFHHKCLKAMGLTKKSAPRALDSSLYDLTCSSCVARLPVLRAYYPVHGKFMPKSAVLKSVTLNAGAPRDRDCVLPQKEMAEMPTDVDIIWEPHFRESLCTCDACKCLYEAANAAWIADPKDWCGAVLAEGNVKGEMGDVLLEDVSDGEIVGDLWRESECERAATRQRVDPEVRRQTEVQQRIREFLQRCVETNGRSMTHAAIIEYLADVKAEVLANMEEHSDDE